MYRREVDCFIPCYWAPIQISDVVLRFRIWIDLSCIGIDLKSISCFLFVCFLMTSVTPTNAVFIGEVVESMVTLKSETITWYVVLNVIMLFDNSMEEIMSEIFEFSFLLENLKHWLFQSVKLWGVFLSKNDGLVKIISSKWLQYPGFQAKLYRTNSMTGSCQQSLIVLTASWRYNCHRRNGTHLKCTIWWVLGQMYTSLKSSPQSS